MSHWKQAEIVTSLRHKVTAAAVSDRRSSRVHTSINRPGTVTDIRPWQRHINPIIALANRSFLQDDVRTSGLESEGRSLRNMKVSASDLLALRPGTIRKGLLAPRPPLYLHVRDSGSPALPRSEDARIPGERTVTSSSVPGGHGGLPGVTSY